jgi:hypothetical protein
VTPAQEHDWSDWQTDGTEHWMVCRNDGCAQESTRAAHSAYGTLPHSSIFFRSIWGKISGTNSPPSPAIPFKTAFMEEMLSLVFLVLIKFILTSLK